MCLLRDTQCAMAQAEELPPYLVSRPNLVDTAADAIRRMIFTEELVPGSRIRELQLCRRLSVSRTPVRAALVALSKEGLVDLVARRGAFVHAYSDRELVEVYQIRAVLDGLAAELAVANAAPEALRLIETTIEEEEREYRRIAAGTSEARLGPRESYALAMHDLRFHRAVLQAAGNQQLLFLMDGGHVMHKSLFVMLKYPLVKRVEVRIEEHRQFLSALRDRDADRARSLARAHVDAMIAALGASSEPG